MDGSLRVKTQSDIKIQNPRFLYKLSTVSVEDQRLDNNRFSSILLY